MANSAKFTDAVSFRAYTEKYADELLHLLFYSSKTQQIATAHEGVKGKLIMTNLALGDLAYRYGSSFGPTADTVVFAPRTLDVVPAKAEFQFIPQDFETSYLGRYRQTGQSSDDLPFEAFILQRILAKLQQEIERSMWGGVAAVSPASTDKLVALYNGYLKKITDLVTATTLTPAAVGGGAYTLANIIPEFESMFDLLDAAYKEAPDMAYFCSPSVFYLYQRAYRDTYSKYTMIEPGKMTLDFAPNVEIISVPGMASSQRVLLTQKSNLHYGYDGNSDASVFNFEKDHRAMDFWLDFKIGVEFGIVDPKLMVVNDLT